MEPTNEKNEEITEKAEENVKTEEISAETKTESEVSAEESQVAETSSVEAGAEASESAEESQVAEVSSVEAGAEATENAEESQAAETSSVEATAEATENAEESQETETSSKTPEELKEERIKKIKIGIIAAGGIFILLAIVYIAAMMGGRNKVIEEEPETVIVAIPTEEPEVTAEPTVEAVVEEEEEMPEESLIGVVQGNARYDECVYADGGSIIVRKADKYGAIDYEGKEIVPVKYTEIGQIPTKEGMFVLATSKTESVTEEKDGTTYSYEEVTTTYTLFDSTGKELYKGNNKIVVSGETYILGIEDKEDSRKNRVEYHKLGTKDKPYLTLYVNDQFSLNGFMDGKTTVMGFTAIPTEDQDTNPTNLNCGIMDSNGKIAWFAQAPGIDAFDKEVKQWKEDNKLLQQNIKSSAKKNKEEKAEEEKEILYDEEGNPIEDADELDDEDADELDEESEDDIDDSEEDEDDYDYEEDELAGGPVFHMDEILNAPVGGYFVYKDLYDVEDPYSWYTDKGAWFADLDTAYLSPDDKKGFKVGNFNNGAIDVKGYVVDGEIYYNFGAYMVLTIGDKDVLIDMSKGKGMTTDSITDKIVVAVYDEINISANDYWMYKDGGKAGYLDLKGEPIKVSYDDATSFVNGYALVIRDGKAIIINEKFDELEEIGNAKSVDVAGDVMIINGDTGIRRYMLKETRNAPQGDNIPSAVAETTPEAKETGKKTKK